MEIYTKENGLMTRDMVKVLYSLQTETSMKVNGLSIRCMGLVA